MQKQKGMSTLVIASSWGHSSNRPAQCEQKRSWEAISLCSGSTAIADIRPCSLVRRSNIFCLHCGVDHTHTGLDTPPCHLMGAGSTRKDWKSLVQVCYRSLLGLQSWPAFYQAPEMALSASGGECKVWVTVQTPEELRAQHSALTQRNATLPKGNTTVNMGSIRRSLKEF